MSKIDKVPKDCCECHDKEWCDSFYGGIGCKYNKVIKTLTPKEATEEKAKDKEDVVKNPSHYKHGTFEVIDEMLIAFGPQRTYDFCIMNAWKYRARAPYKGKFEQDMDKANRYLEMAHQINEANKELLFGVPVNLIKE